jgi:hypothetical protein
LRVCGRYTFSKVLYTLYRKYAKALTFESLWKAAAVLLRDLECVILLECVLLQAAAVLLRDLALSCRLAGSSCIEGLLLLYSRSLLTLVRRASPGPGAPLPPRGLIMHGRSILHQNSVSLHQN